MSEFQSPEECVEYLRELLRECDAVIRNVQEEYGGQTQLLKKLQEVLD